MNRPYYSQRAGRLPSPASFGLADIKRLFLLQYRHLESEGHFQEHFGFECVDAGYTPGLLGTDLQAEFLLALRKPNLWPVQSTIDAWTEDDLFDVIEYLCDHVSKPTERYFHSFSGCGWHCREFDGIEGKVEYRAQVNRVLAAYDTGFELSSKGQIMALPDSGLEPLLAAAVPAADPENITSRVDAAIMKFRRHRASLDNRRDAVRDLADVLEYLRPRLKTVFSSKDEQDLFNIVNNFGIRHHNEKQKTEYDRGIWYSWLFYYYLATIHAALRFLEKAPGKA